METMKYKDKKDFKEYYRVHKKEFKEYSKKSYLRHKKDKHNYHMKKMKAWKLILSQLKINGCAICGSYKTLEFHHVLSGYKDFNISHGWRYSNKKLSDELNKCILLCHKCHMHKESCKEYE